MVTSLISSVVMSIAVSFAILHATDRCGVKISSVCSPCNIIAEKSRGKSKSGVKARKFIVKVAVTWDTGMTEAPCLLIGGREPSLTA